MRQLRTYGSERGALGNRRPYRNRQFMRRLLKIDRQAAARHDHGQAPILWGRESEDERSARSSPAQGAQQSVRELSSADTTMRADYEAAQINPAGATSPHGP